MSAYITDALKEKVLLDDLSSLLEDTLEASGGSMTRAERRAADQALGVKPKASSVKRYSR